MTQTPNSSADASSSKPNLSRQNWIVTIVCALITILGGVYTTYSNNRTQTEIEALKSKNDALIARMKADNEKDIRDAELRSQEKILSLKFQFENDRDMRAKSAADESTLFKVRAAECDEIKAIRNRMSDDITFLRRGDSRSDDALLSLQSAYFKHSSYFTAVGQRAMGAELPEKVSDDFYVAKRDLYTAVLEGYNAELRSRCAK